MWRIAKHTASARIPSSAFAYSLICAQGVRVSWARLCAAVGLRTLSVRYHWLVQGGAPGWYMSRTVRECTLRLHTVVLLEKELSAYLA